MGKELSVSNFDYRIRNSIIISGTAIEKKLNEVLCYLLDIDLKKSVSFGYSSFALGLNQKVTLINDLSKIDSSTKEKIILVAEIRNKFAHIYEVSTFQNLFLLFPKKQEEINKKLNKIYKPEEFNASTSENEYLSVFSLMTIEIIYNLDKTLLDHAYNLGTTEGEKQASEELVAILHSNMIKTKEGQKYWEKVVSHVIQINL